jgi:hypothetical protein
MVSLLLAIARFLVRRYSLSFARRLGIPEPVAELVAAVA